MRDTDTSKNTCLAMLEAESEADAARIVSDPDGLLARGDWRPIDGRETNFNVTSNQASDGGKALTELMTNMVDAVLLRLVREAGIDPKGSGAPQSMYEAVDQYVKNLYGGRLSQLDPKYDSWLRDFAQKNLVIGITGARTVKEGLPCYTFVDNGEGQHPKDFEGTFLSLSAGNKKDILFVQGKYNMGSSGVLGYCGRNWYKLIVSRRHDKSGNWGWTLVRRRPTTSEEMPVAEYFVMPDGTIPSFTSDALRPFKTGTGETYDGMRLETGTVVKLYDYQLGSRFVSFKGAREAFNENLVETILPFRIMDFRQLPSTAAGRKRAETRGGDRALGIDSRPFYGMEFLLLRSYKEDELVAEEDAAGEKLLNITTIEDIDLGKITVSAVVLKGLPSWLDKRQRNNRVFHAVNGQVQFKQTRGHLSQHCKFPALMDRVVVIVDASKMSFYAHNEVWKGDREHVRRTILGQKYLEVVTRELAGSPVLKELHSAIANQELERATKAQSNDLFQKLIDADPTLAALLSGRDPDIRAPLPSDTVPIGPGTVAPDLRFSPTFVRFDDKTLRKGRIEIPVNRRRIVTLLTDAQDDYFDRHSTPGRLILPDWVLSSFSHSRQLHNGRLHLSLEPVATKIRVGDSMGLEVALKDDGMPVPVEAPGEIVIVITEETDPSNPPKKPPSPLPPRDVSGLPSVGLPKCVLLTKDGRPIEGYSVEKWPDDFGEADGGEIKDLGEEGVVYKINYDNVYHINYRKQQKGKIAQRVVSEKYVLGMRILMLGFEHALRQRKTTASTEDSTADFADDFRSMAARGAAATVLALADNLPKIVDKSSIGSEDE